MRATTDVPASSREAKAQDVPVGPPFTKLQMNRCHTCQRPAFFHDERGVWMHWDGEADRVKFDRSGRQVPVHQAVPTEV